MRAAVALLLAASASADIVWLNDGQIYEGKVLSADGDPQVVLNPYNSTMKEMVWGLKKFDRSAVAKIEITPVEPIREYWWRVSDPKADHAELMKFCGANDLRVEEREEALEVLAVDAQNADARAVIGADVDAALKASPRHNKDIQDAIKDWNQLDAAARAAAYERLKKDYGVTLPIEYFDRVARSRLKPDGQVVEDIPLTYDSAHASGVYTVWLPKGYNPHKAYPMLLTLHGTWNGLGGIGEGHTFIKHFTYAETKKWDVIIISPTADPRPWTAQGDRYVLAILDEAMLQYNVDMNRVYVTGHSMGGGGTWYFGTKYARMFAAFAPAAAAGSGDELNAAAWGTGMYIYHSSDDPSAPVGPDRKAAQNLREANADFVYTEWTDQQHGWPQAVIADSFVYFKHHHRMKNGKDGPVPIHGTRPSFAEPAWPEEERYFPAPKAPGRTGEVEDLVGEVALGGTVAQNAATRLLELKNRRAIVPLAALLGHLEAGCDTARMQAARALGAVKDPGAATALLAALLDPSWKVRAFAAEALAVAADPADLPWLLAALQDVAAEFDALAARWIRDETWTQIHAFNAALVATLASFHDPAAWAAADAVCVRRILLTDAKSGSDNIDPEPARRASALRILKALPDFKDAGVRDAIEAIRARVKGDDVVKAADEAVKRLGG